MCQIGFAAKSKNRGHMLGFALLVSTAATLCWFGCVTCDAMGTGHLCAVRLGPGPPPPCSIRVPGGRAVPPAARWSSFCLPSCADVCVTDGDVPSRTGILAGRQGGLARAGNTMMLDASAACALPCSAFNNRTHLKVPVTRTWSSTSVGRSVVVAMLVARLGRAS